MVFFLFCSLTHLLALHPSLYFHADSIKLCPPCSSSNMVNTKPTHSSSTPNAARVDSNGNAITRMHSSMKRPRAPIACIRCHHKKVYISLQPSQSHSNSFFLRSVAMGNIQIVLDALKGAYCVPIQAAVGLEMLNPPVWIPLLITFHNWKSRSSRSKRTLNLSAAYFSPSKSCLPPPVACPMSLIL